jgi:hypothetical protein
VRRGKINKKKVVNKTGSKNRRKAGKETVRINQILKDFK